MKRILTRYVLILLLCVAFLKTGFGHDVPVHRAITSAAVNASTGFANYLKDNNLTRRSVFPYPAGQEGEAGTVIPNAQGTASSQIINGSAREDDNQEDAGGGRSLNHFYDPISKNGLDGTLPGRPSPEWATVYNDVNHDFYWGGMNNYSWQNARFYQSNSIVNNSPNYRSSQAGYMFRSIGQVVHLLEDTTQPQHVRDEAHLDKYPVIGIDTPKRSKFEDAGTANLPYLTTHYLAPRNLDWIAAGFTCVTNFWDHGLYHGNSAGPLDASENGGQTLGLAEWCNGNFLTVRGTYAEFPQGNVNGGPPYPYPRLDSTDYDHYQGQPAAYATLIASFDGSYNLYGVPTAIYRCIVRKTKQGVPVPRHCAVDLLAAYRPGVFGAFPGSICGVHPDDLDVMESYFSVLLPKAVAYSSGLLDYYFRGRLQITSFFVTNSTKISFTAKNISPQAFKGGGFRVFQDDVAGDRGEATDLTTTYNPATGLAPSATITGTFTFPPATPFALSNSFTLAFFGTIGVNANGQPLDTVDAGMGIAVAYTNIGPGVIFDMSWNSSAELDMYLTDPGGVVLYEPDLAPANGNTNSDYCTVDGGGDSEILSGVQHMVVSNMKDGSYVLWINYEGSGPPGNATLKTSDASGTLLTTESFTLTTAASGQYGHHGWPIGVSGPATQPSWYIRKAITIKNGYIFNY